MYNKKVLQYFKNPRHFGKIKNADGVGKVGNIVCGDVMWMYIKVAPNAQGEDVLQDIKFETYGCVAALATSETVAAAVKGKTVQEALQITHKEMVHSLGGLPPIKVHCSVLAVDALLEAIYDYLSRAGKTISPELKERHARIEKEKEMIAEKYGDLVEPENKSDEAA